MTGAEEECAKDVYVRIEEAEGSFDVGAEMQRKYATRIEGGF